SGRAAEKFGAMVAALGGPVDFVERPETYLPAVTIVRPVHPDCAGFVMSIDTRAIGVAIVELGGGRMRASDAIDHAVGFTRLAGIGAAVGADPVAQVHAHDEETASRAVAVLKKAYRITDEFPERNDAVGDRITGV